MTKFRTFIFSLLCSSTLLGCLRLHHIQLGDIDQTGSSRLKPFNIKISETGISLDEARSIANAFVGKGDKERLGQIGDMISMFQMGPVTGKHIYTDKYAENLGSLIYQECPSGNITGLIVVRETRDYPVISGEIINVYGYCRVRK